MREIFAAIEAGLVRQEKMALATVVRTWGSSPRGVGSKMVIGADGAMTGSVSGGCVEGAVIEAGMEVIREGKPKLLHFGVADETAWEVGLACGGEIEVFVQPVDGEAFLRMKPTWEAGTLVVRAFPIRGPQSWLGQELLRGDLPSQLESLAERVEELVKEALARQAPSCVTLQISAEQRVEIFLDVITPRDTLVIVGGVHIATFLVEFARVLGFRTVVIDPRRKFANRERFPQADEVIQSWPQKVLANLPLTRTTAVAVLTHDPKIDDPALVIVLTSPAFYIGALGSQGTQADRRTRLLEAGILPAELDKLHGPIGLELGARSPGEIALAIMAEIVQVKNGIVERNPGSSV
jgi:xanthine dehydrogenase accessory factor